MSISLSLKINVWGGEMVELDLLFLDNTVHRFKINLKRIIMILNGVLTLNYHHAFLNHLISLD